MKPAALKALIPYVSQAMGGDEAVSELVSRGLLKPNAVGSYMPTDKAKALWGLLLKTASEFCDEQAPEGSGDPLAILSDQVKQKLRAVDQAIAQDTYNDTAARLLVNAAAHLTSKYGEAKDPNWKQWHPSPTDATAG